MGIPGFLVQQVPFPGSPVRKGLMDSRAQLTAYQDQQVHQFLADYHLQGMRSTRRMRIGQQQTEARKGYIFS